MRRFAPGEMEKPSVRVSEDDYSRRQKTGLPERFAPNEDRKPGARFLCLLSSRTTAF
ncbi:MAG: hypothetical protein LBD06_13590 [Candidatus Accumulibacter sp.]|nr:hypothetical protein [Accumulibacter sp.]